MQRLAGLYHAEINGKKAGNIMFAPGITDYLKRVQYQIYDVTDLLLEGDNELTVSLPMVGIGEAVVYGEFAISMAPGQNCWCNWS